MKPNQTKFLIIISLRSDWLNSKSRDCPTYGCVFRKDVWLLFSAGLGSLPSVGKEGFAPSYLCARGLPAGDGLSCSTRHLRQSQDTSKLGQAAFAFITDRSVFSMKVLGRFLSHWEEVAVGWGQPVFTYPPTRVICI